MRCSRAGHVCVCVLFFVVVFFLSSFLQPIHSREKEKKTTTTTIPKKKKRKKKKKSRVNAVTLGWYVVDTQSYVRHTTSLSGDFFGVSEEQTKTRTN
jgi:uncharacterized membrane protein